MPTTPTPNLRLNRVAADVRNWHDRVNANFSVLDAAIGTYIALSNLQGVWTNSTAYTVGQAVVDDTSGTIYSCLVNNTSAASPTTFAEERSAHPTYWTGYNVPAQSRGTWMPGTAYQVNNFVYADNKYAIALDSHTSGSTFATDVTANHWGILVDGTIFGAQVLPTPGGAADANKLVGIDGSGVGYVLKQASDLYAFLGASGIGQSVLQSASAAAIRVLLDVPSASLVQPLDALLTSISNVATAGVLASNALGASVSVLALGAMGQTLIATADAAAVRTAIGLGALAVLNTVGTTQIDDAAATNAKLANVPTLTLKARKTAATGVSEDVTVTELGQYFGLWVPLVSGGSVSVSAQATYTLDSIPSWVKFLRITLDLFPVNNDVALNILLRKASGTDIVNVYQIERTVAGASSITATEASNQAAITPFGNTQNISNSGGVHCVINITNIQSARYKRGSILVNSRDGTVAVYTNTFNFRSDDAAAITGFKISFGTGNINDGLVLTEGHA